VLALYENTFFNSFNLDIHRIWNNAKSSAGFRTSAMFKTSTTLGFIWDNNTCIVQPPIIKYSSCISCYLVWDSPKRKQSTSLYKRNGAPPPKENTMQGYERLTKIRNERLTKINVTHVIEDQDYMEGHKMHLIFLDVSWFSITW
jgi:hypothetical protein